MQINNNVDILNSKNIYDKNTNSGPISNTTYSLYQTLKIFVLFQKKMIISTTLSSSYTHKKKLLSKSDSTLKI